MGAAGSVVAKWHMKRSGEELRQQYAAETERPEVEAVLQGFKLDRDAGFVLYDLFQQLDTTGRGRITVAAMLRGLKAPVSPFAVQQLTSALRRDAAEAGEDRREWTVDFAEFAVAIWNFLSQDQIKRALFDMFDPDQSGQVTLAEVEAMARLVHDAANVEHELFASDDALARPVTWDEFCRLTDRHRDLLRPAYKLQQHIAARAGGALFWKRERGKRADVLGDAGDAREALDRLERAVNESWVARKEAEAAEHAEARRKRRERRQRVRGEYERRKRERDLERLAEWRQRHVGQGMPALDAYRGAVARETRLREVLAAAPERGEERRLLETALGQATARTYHTNAAMCRFWKQREKARLKRVVQNTVVRAYRALDAGGAELESVKEQSKALWWYYKNLPDNKLTFDELLDRVKQGYVKDRRKEAAAQHKLDAQADWAWRAMDEEELRAEVAAEVAAELSAPEVDLLAVAGVEPEKKVFKKIPVPPRPLDFVPHNVELTFTGNDKRKWADENRGNPLRLE